MYKRGGKRAFDLLLAGLALVILMPVIGTISVLVRLKLGSPVLFRQQRPGLHGRPFAIYKFRTMFDARDAQGNLLPDKDRLSPFGRFLRSTSLDELPELWNVFRGDMSLVGPRPLLIRYMPYFTADERIRFQARPGITGLAQVSGRNDLDWDARVAADVRYVQDCSLSLDLRILFLTIVHTVMRRGVQTDPSAVMLDFDEERRQRGTHTGRETDPPRQDCRHLDRN